MNANTTTATTAHTFRAEQAVMIVLDPRRPARLGAYVEDGDKAGTVRVRYEVQGKGEKFSEVKIERVTAVEAEAIDAPAVEEVPVVDVNADAVKTATVGMTPTVHLFTANEVGLCTEAREGAQQRPLIWVSNDATCPACREAAGLGEAPEVEPAPVEAPKAAKAPKRAPLREGYVTPTGLMKEINARGLYKGNAGELRVQALYSYLRNAPKDHQSPFGDFDGRYSAPLTDALAWWVAKDERVAKKTEELAQRPAKGGAQARTARAAQRAAERALARAAAAKVKAEEALKAAQERATAAAEAYAAAQRAVEAATPAEAE